MLVAKDLTINVDSSDVRVYLGKHLLAVIRVLNGRHTMETLATTNHGFKSVDDCVTQLLMGLNSR
jgi:hypothetical protein